MSKKMAELEERMRLYGLAFPEATEDHPWEHISLKVRGKTFVFLGGHKDSAGQFSMTLKLPVSAEMAVTLPFVKPIHWKSRPRSGRVFASIQTTRGS